MATGSMVLGLVVAPMGWVLLLAATVTPRWREFSRRPGFPRDVSFSDGLWESCVEVISVPGRACQAIPQETAISWPMQMLRALTVISVLTGVLSYSLGHVGVRWWTDSPNPKLTGTAGLLLVLSGAMYLCATSYMAYKVLENMANPQTPAGDKFRLGTCLYLGWSGGVAEILAGICLAVNFQRKEESRGTPRLALGEETGSWALVSGGLQLEEHSWEQSWDSEHKFDRGGMVPAAGG
uniref:Claudin n=1 Tax=Gopherus evgoodei TaxID=1825980 RepID=A0A8C4YV81_9SAUR